MTMAESGEKAVSSSASRRTRRHDRTLLLTVIGAGLLVIWAYWWIATWDAGILIYGDRTRVPAWRFLGLDFLHNYDAARMWLAGRNPYVEDIDFRGVYAYPPAVLPLYVWTEFVSRFRAVQLWMTFIAAVVTATVWLARRTRMDLGLTRLPLVFMLAVALCSLPVVFAMERGQGDAIVLLMLLASVVLMRRPPSWPRDLAIGFCLALATWVKIYPVFLILALLPLRHWRVFVICGFEAALMGLIPYRATRYWMASVAASQQDRIGFVAEIKNWLTDPGYKPAQLMHFASLTGNSHSFTTYWAVLWSRVGIEWLARVPAVLGVGAVLGPLLLWVSYRVYRSPGRLRLALPYLLWIAALATFWMPVSYDYNLIYLPLAVLAVCDRRDPLIVTVALFGTVLWWQPFVVGWEHAIGWFIDTTHIRPPMTLFQTLLSIQSDTLFFLKLLTLFAVGISIVVRARETSEVPDSTGLLAPMTQPAFAEGAPMPAR
jgi:hypothetical protein